MRIYFLLTARKSSVVVCYTKRPQSKNRSLWWKSLMELTANLDVVINKFNRECFIKLSVRSPKDSAFCLTQSQSIIKQELSKLVANNNNNKESKPENYLSEHVSALKFAAWRALRVTSGAEALQLLLRSDRIYLDILQHELFLQSQQQQEHQANNTDNNNNNNNNDNTNNNVIADNKTEEKKGKPAEFNLNILVSEFFEGFHPDWEFRGFVSKGKRTGLTIYNPWVYSIELLNKKSKVLELIEGLWSIVENRISHKIQDYSVDFAVNPSCEEKQVWIIEINAFLPPLAGSGLFSMHKPEDVELVNKGPFEFRIRDKPVTYEDFTVTKIDPITGRTTTISMEPANKMYMLFVEECRKRLENKQNIDKLTPESVVAQYNKRPSNCVIS